MAPSLPFLQVRYAVEGRVSALFSLRSIRERFRRAPWAFAFALMVLLLAAVPLYLLKIEMIPREAAWLPSLVFVIFLAPAHALVGWAYARSWRSLPPTPLDSPRPRPHGDYPGLPLLRPRRRHRPVHLVGRYLEPLSSSTPFCCRYRS